MAPERFRTGDVQPSSDIYALACVLFECLTGEPPFPGSTLEQVAVGHMVAPPPRPSELSGSVPSGLDRVIETGLAKQTTDRYPTAVEMAAAAREAITEPTGHAHPTAPTQQAPVPHGGLFVPPGPVLHYPLRSLLARLPHHRRGPPRRRGHPRHHRRSARRTSLSSSSGRSRPSCCWSPPVSSRPSSSPGMTSPPPAPHPPPRRPPLRTSTALTAPTLGPAPISKTSRRRTRLLQLPVGP